jgi:hypothetical protein
MAEFDVVDMPEWCPGDINKVDRACDRFLRSRERIDTPVDWSRVKWIPKIPGTPPPAARPQSTDSWHDRCKTNASRIMNAHFQSMAADRLSPEERGRAAMAANAAARERSRIAQRERSARKAGQ